MKWLAPASPSGSIAKRPEVLLRAQARRYEADVCSLDSPAEGPFIHRRTIQICLSFCQNMNSPKARGPGQRCTRVPVETHPSNAT
jgi:hypothetical protein